MKTKALVLIATATLMGCLFNASHLRATPAFTPGITETEGPTYTPTHYVDFATGNDSNAGTIGNPWKHAPGMPGWTGSHTPVAGNVIALKRGSVWRKTDTWNIGQSGTSGNPIVYTAYGTGALPKYTVLELYSSGWSVHSGNVWKRTTGGSVQRVFVNEEGMGRASSVDMVGQASIVNDNNTGIIKYWDHSNGILYLYSPAGNPGSVSVVEGLQGGIAHTLLATNRSHVYIDRIAFYGGDQHSVRFDTTGSYAGTNMRFTNGAIKCVKRKALSVFGTSTSAFTNGVIKWNVIAACNGPSTRPVPDDATYAFGVHPWGGSGSDNGITLVRRVQGWIVAQNDVSDFYHTQIQVQPDHDGPVTTSNNLVEHNEVHCENINYGHGIAIVSDVNNEYVALLKDNTSRYNYVHDIWVADTHEGTNTKIYGNLYDSIYGSPRKSTNTWSGWGGEAFHMRGFGVSTGGVFAYNTIVNAGGAAVALMNPPSGVVIANNIFSHNGTRRFGISLRDQYETPPRPDLDKNILYSPETADIYQHEVHSTRITVAEMEAIESTWNNNIAADPQFTSYGAHDFTLGASSPARGAAKDISSILPESSGWTDLGCWQDAATAPGSYEAETLTIAASSGDSASIVSNASASDGQFRLYSSNAVHDYVTFTVNVPQSGTYDIKAIIPHNSYRGVFQLSVDGVDMGSPYDAYAAGGSPTFMTSTLASGVTLAAGNRAFKFTVTGKNASSTDYQIAIDAITLEEAAGAVPTEPGDLLAMAVSQTQINLTWTDNSSDETGFKIERATGTGTFAEIDTVGADAISYSNATGLTAGTTYTYRVRAYNASGNSAYSNTSAATTLALSTFEAEDLTIAGSSGDVTSIVSNASASGGEFRLYKSDAPGDYITFTVNVPQDGNYDISAIVPKNSFRGVFQLSVDGVNVGSSYDGYASGSSATFVSATLAAGVSLTSGSHAFTFTVTGKNASSTDYQIALDTITLEQTLLAAPMAPTNLVATAISQAQINLSWADNADNETGFKIERKTGAGAFAEIATAGVNATSYNNSTGLAAGTNYSYRARAYNAVADSGYSNTSSATTFATTTTHEAEGLTIAADSGDIASVVTNASASSGEFRLYKSDAAGDYITFTVNVPQDGSYDISAIVPKNSFRGVFQLSIDGVNVGATYDGYAGSLTFVTSTLASGVSLASGNRAFKFTVTGKNASSTDYQIALDTISLEQVGL